MEKEEIPNQDWRKEKEKKKFPIKDWKESKSKYAKRSLEQTMSK